jgi:hypothetical protein
MKKKIGKFSNINKENNSNEGFNFVGMTWTSYNLLFFDWLQVGYEGLFKANVLEIKASCLGASYKWKMKKNKYINI